MKPMENDDLGKNSRYREVTRRLFLRRAAQAIGAAALLPVITSCGDDAAAFTTTTTLLGNDGAEDSGISTTTRAPGVTTTTPTTTIASPGAVLNGEAVIAFSYTASGGGGRVRNPYVAVWIEDSAGELVDTVALWFLQTQKGLRWLNDLRRWYSVDGSEATIDAVSGATRRPGEYIVAWDMTDVDGKPVHSGEYFVCIEAAREHGPYSLIREAVEFTAGMAAVSLSNDGELHDAVVDLNA